jgi:hypothetical protein
VQATASGGRVTREITTGAEPGGRAALVTDVVGMVLEIFSCSRGSIPVGGPRRFAERRRSAEQPIERCPVERAVA